MSPSWGAMTATCFLTNFSPAGGRGAALQPGSCCAWTAEQTRRDRSLWTGAPRTCFPGVREEEPAVGPRPVPALTRPVPRWLAPELCRGEPVWLHQARPPVWHAGGLHGAWHPHPCPVLGDRQPPRVRRGSSCGVFIDALASSFLFPVRWELFSSLKSCLCGQRCCAHTVVAVRVPFLRLRQRELSVPLHSRASLEKSRFLLCLRFRVLIAGVSSGP